MGRRKAEVEEAAQNVESEDIPAVGTDGSATEPPKRRGRPPGSKNKKKGQSEGIPVSALPDELVAQIAMLPISVPTAILAKKKNVVMVVNPQFITALPGVFKAWLTSIGFNLTPGWALVGLYAGIIATAQFHPAASLRGKVETPNETANVGTPKDSPVEGGDSTVTA